MPNPVIAGYEIISRLGQGGMGAVYRARQISMEREVALKILAPELAKNEGFKDRFLREARLAGGISHPHLIQVHDVGSAGKYCYYSMEMVQGVTLKAHLAQHGPMPETQALDLMRQTAEALHVCHQKGIIHRDIKPENIMLTDEGIAKVADLGLAKPTEVESELTLTGTVMGTPHFMSPEQARAEHVDGRSDLYSLGASFFNLLSGQHVFEETTTTAILLAHIQKPPPRLRSVAPQCSQGMERILLGLLDKEPEQRYRTAAALIEDLDRLALGQAVLGPERSKGSSDPRIRSAGGRSQPAVVTAPPARPWWSYAALGGAGAATVVLVAILGFDASDEQRDPAENAPLPKSEMTAQPHSPPTDTQAPSMQGSFADMLAEANRWSEEHPDQYALAIYHYERVIDRARGTPVELQADRERIAVARRWHDAWDDALEDLKRRVLAHIESDAFDSAVNELKNWNAGMPLPPEREEPHAFMNDLMNTIASAGEQRGTSLMAAARDALEQGRLDDALAVADELLAIEHSDSLAHRQRHADILRERVAEQRQRQLSDRERELRQRWDAVATALLQNDRQAVGTALDAIDMEGNERAQADRDLVTATFERDARRHEAVVAALEQRLNQEIELMVEDESVTGTLTAVDGEGLRLLIRLVSHTGSSAEMVRTIAWDALDAEEYERWLPDPDDDAPTEILHGLISDPDGTSADQIAQLPDGPLRAALQRASERRIIERAARSRDDDAAAAWNRLAQALPDERKADRLRPIRRHSLLARLQRFLDTYGDTAFAEDHRDEIMDAFIRLGGIAPPPPDAVAFWDFDGDERTAFLGGLDPESVELKMHDAFRQPSMNGQGLRIGHNGEFILTGIGLDSEEASICARILPENIGMRTVISQAHGHEEGSPFLRIDCDAGERRLEAWLRVDDRVYMLGGQGVPIAKHRWSHIALTYDGDQVHLYVDGDLVAERMVHGRFNSDPMAPLAIGSQPFSSDDASFVGLIDDVGLYDRALDQHEIRALVGPMHEEDGFDHREPRQQERQPMRDRRW